MEHIRMLGLLGLLIGFTLSVVGCAVSEKTPADLVGTQWVLVSLNGESLIEGTEIMQYRKTNPVDLELVEIAG
jgi:hypothetical protein